MISGCVAPYPALGAGAWPMPSNHITENRRPWRSNCIPKHTEKRDM
jgi:hypothetical protein